MSKLAGRERDEELGAKPGKPPPPHPQPSPTALTFSTASGLFLRLTMSCTMMSKRYMSERMLPIWGGGGAGDGRGLVRESRGATGPPC